MKKMNNKDIMNRIKCLRMKKGITQKQIANLLKCTPSMYSKIEKGVTPMKVYDFVKVCNFTGMNKADVINVLFANEME